MTILENCRIITGQYDEKGSVIIKDDKISALCLDLDETSAARLERARAEGAGSIDLEGKILMAGGIDLHVHFREPGLTHKADMATESAAAVLGGVTSFVDMPNTRPVTTTAEALQAKLEAAEGRVYANYGFNFGATNDNADEIERLIATEGDPEGGAEGIGRHDFCAVKVFMGSSTGNMLVDKENTLARLFRIKGKPVFIHSEDEQTIHDNLIRAKEKYGENIPWSEHSLIRSRMACIRSTIKALELAIAEKTRLHLLHISTREEADMVRAAKLQNSGISGETSANYLWFCDEDYERLGSRCKCNPSIKTAADRDYLIASLEDGVIDTIGSDHAPHLQEEKAGKYLDAPSGMPSVQFQLPALLTLASQEKLSWSTVARAFSERPAEIGGIADRGFLKEGYQADLVVIDPEKPFTVTPECIASKCGWSPYEGETFACSVVRTYVNGKCVVEDGKISGNPEGRRLYFG